jgi:hypothetical protein
MHSNSQSNSQLNWNLRWVEAAWCHILKTKSVLTLKLVGPMAVDMPARLLCSDFAERRRLCWPEGRKSHACFVPFVRCDGRLVVRALRGRWWLAGGCWVRDGWCQWCQPVSRMWREHHNQQALHFFVLTLHKKALFLERTPKKLRGKSKERSRSFRSL